MQAAGSAQRHDIDIDRAPKELRKAGISGHIQSAGSRLQHGLIGIADSRELQLSGMRLDGLEMVDRNASAADYADADRPTGDCGAMGLHDCDLPLRSRAAGSRTRVS